jgi:hypothetical protein
VLTVPRLTPYRGTVHRVISLELTK